MTKKLQAKRYVVLVEQLFVGGYRPFSFDSKWAAQAFARDVQRSTKVRIYEEVTS